MCSPTKHCRRKPSVENSAQLNHLCHSHRQHNTNTLYKGTYLCTMESILNQGIEKIAPQKRGQEVKDSLLVHHDDKRHKQHNDGNQEVGERHVVVGRGELHLLVRVETVKHGCVLHPALQGGAHR